MTTVDREEVVVLTEALIDGAISPEEFERLGRWLKDDPAARALYLEHCSVDSLLRWRWQPEIAPVQVGDESVKSGNIISFPILNRFSRVGVIKAAAAVAILLLVGVFLKTGDSDSGRSACSG